MTKIHGITDDMVRGQPPIEDVLPEFVEFLGDPETILLAHNASFDVGFLSAAFSRCKAIFPEHPVTEGQLRRVLASGNPEQRAWAISHLLRYADWDDIWSFVDRNEIREIFHRLELPPSLSTDC